MESDSNESFITEGKAKISKSKSVFYNKVQEFNRDLSVLAVHTFLKHKIWSKSKKVFIKDKITILDALSATGFRSIRYSLECVECSLPIEIIANDLLEDAVHMIQKNIEKNNVKNVIVNHEDASLFMHKKLSTNQRISIIDLDPYGSPTPFLDSAVQTISDGGLLMITSTDMAVLAGNHGEACYAKYGSYPVRAKFCHEMALRILIASVESHANRYGRHVVPLLSLSIDFYVRVFFQVFTSRSEAQKSTSKMSYIYLCKGCESFQLQPLSQQKGANPLHIVPANILYDKTCELCDHRLQIGGPIWSNPIYDPDFVNLMQTELSLNFNTESFGTYRRMEGILQLVSEELLDSPLYYHLDRLCCLANCRMPPIRQFRSALINAGYQVSYSHALKNTIKTNAPNTFIWCVIKELCKLCDSKQKDSTPASVIVNKDFDFKVCFEPAEEEPKSKSLNFLRYQLNPEENWGPKPKPNNDDIDKRERNQGKRNLKGNHSANKVSKVDS